MASTRTNVTTDAPDNAIMAQHPVDQLTETEQASIAPPEAYTPAPSLTGACA